MVLASALDIGGMRATGYPPAEPAVPSPNALGARQLSAVAYGAKWLADRWRNNRVCYPIAPLI